MLFVSAIAARLLPYEKSQLNELAFGVSIGFKGLFAFCFFDQDETFVEARASLGCVLVELEQRELALSSFRGALKHHPDYPDVHFHLARLLDDMGQDGQAATHWQTFLKLAPKSPWAEEARDRLGSQDT